MRMTKARFIARFVFTTGGALAARRGSPGDVPPVRLEMDGGPSATAQQSEFFQGRPPENEQVWHHPVVAPPTAIYCRLEISRDLLVTFWTAKERQTIVAARRLGGYCMHAVDSPSL